MHPKSLLRLTYGVIILGLVAEIIFFLILKVTGRNLPLSIFIADFCNKIAWTYVVCVAIVIAKSLTNNNVPATGLAGFLSVPPALYFGGFVQKAVSEALGIDASTTGIVLFIPLVIKTVEFGLLALSLAHLAKTEQLRGAYRRTGLLLGVLAAVAVNWFKIATEPEITFMELIIVAINEIIIPAGCAVIVYTAAKGLNKTLGTP